MEKLEDVRLGGAGQAKNPWQKLIRHRPTFRPMNSWLLPSQSVNSNREAISHATLSDVWGDFFATYNCFFLLFFLPLRKKKVADTVIPMIQTEGKDNLGFFLAYKMALV